MCSKTIYSIHTARIRGRTRWQHKHSHWPRTVGRPGRRWKRGPAREALAPGPAREALEAWMARVSGKRWTRVYARCVVLPGMPRAIEGDNGAIEGDNGAPGRDRST